MKNLKTYIQENTVPAIKASDNVKDTKWSHSEMTLAAQAIKWSVSHLNVELENENDKNNEWKTKARASIKLMKDLKQIQTDLEKFAKMY